MPGWDRCTRQMPEPGTRCVCGSACRILKASMESSKDSRVRRQQQEGWGPPGKLQSAHTKLLILRYEGLIGWHVDLKLRSKG
eukprot:1144359-Pelagomonas_calceolata.AAC.1